MQLAEKKVEVAVPKYHQSQISMFLKCGKQWEFRYLMGIKTPPSAALTVGSAVDGAITRNLIKKKENGTGITLEEATDAYSTDFDIRSKETEWGEDDPGQQKDIGAKCLEVHHTQFAPNITPETVQEEFVIETDAGYALGGTLDLVETNGTIVDSKTSKQKYDEDAVRRAIQPTMYDFAYQAIRGKKSPQFRYDIMIKPTKTIGARAQQVHGEVTRADHEWLFGTINQMHKAIQAGVALPAPEGSWWCSAKWCGYWSMCKGKK